ncbi:hypothetical protein [Emticicia sp. SJ17W-69]|uniref:hypothetical protein n=1 Tax=Emticicia sp. SJ17W-69 TaxID=3421657 RepID=UPI003EBDB709
MKKTITTFICLLLSFQIAFCQTQAEKLFAAMKKEFEANPHKAIQERAVENYVLVSGSGYIANKTQIMGLFKNVRNVDISFKDLKIRQSGNTVIAIGIEHSIRHYNDGTPDLISDYASTYVYEIKGNNLMYLNGQHTYLAAENTLTEQESIKKMLKQETIDVYATKDVNGYFLDSPTTFRGWNTRTGYSTKFGFAEIKKENDATFGNRPREMNPINENFTFKFYSSNAVLVTYDQYLYGKEQAPSKEMRMLEKVNGSWKIAGLIALWDYSGNAFEQGNVKKTIEAETNAYHAGDVETMNKQWAYNAQYVERQQAYLKTLGMPVYLKGEQLRAFGEEFKKVHKPTGQTYKISDYEAHVGTTNAWVTYTQEVFNADGKPFNKTRELRILERLDGWKIVAMSHVEF